MDESLSAGELNLIPSRPKMLQAKLAVWARCRGQDRIPWPIHHLTPLERTLRRPVNPTVYSQKELRAKLTAGNHFLKAIQKGKNTF